MKQLVADLWNGRLPLARAFWEYAIVYGSLANLVATLFALAAFAKDLPAALGLFLFFLPAPYNLLMVVSVWKSAARYQGPVMWPALARVLIVVWAAVCSLA
ncbi:MAG: hypothetical protein WD871_10320 [Xanthobacteraceae bacterium]